VLTERGSASFVGLDPSHAGIKHFVAFWTSEKHQHANIHISINITTELARYAISGFVVTFQLARSVFIETRLSLFKLFPSIRYHSLAGQSRPEGTC
jgi:hypothetical protein